MCKYYGRRRKIRHQDNYTTNEHALVNITEGEEQSRHQANHNEKKGACVNIREEEERSRHQDTHKENDVLVLLIWAMKNMVIIKQPILLKNVLV